MTTYQQPRVTAKGLFGTATEIPERVIQKIDMKAVIAQSVELNKPILSKAISLPLNVLKQGIMEIK